MNNNSPAMPPKEQMKEKNTPLIQNNAHLKRTIELTNAQQNLIQRLYYNGFKPNMFVSLNHHIVNLSQMNLVCHFKEALKTYYSCTFGCHFNKKKDQQYPLIAFLENGKIRDIEKHPHLHVLAEVPQDKADDFIDTIRTKMRFYYPSTSVHVQNITDRPFDMLSCWTYSDKEQVESKHNPSLIHNKIFTHKDFQKSIQRYDESTRDEYIEWYESLNN